MIVRFLSAAILVWTVSACSSNADLAPGKSGLRTTVSGKTYEQVWDATIRGIQNTSDDRGLDVARKPYITLQNKKEGRIEAEAGVSLWSWGELVGVYVTPPREAPQHTVEVQSLSKLKTNLTSKDWETQVLANIKKELNQ